MEPTKEQVVKMKTIELEMLKVFIEICEKEGLKYFVVGGTALGAVRHKGFIPWDDDIDVALPREDYERFLTVAQGYLPENMFLQTHKTDSNCPLVFAKIRKTDTTFIETSVSKMAMNHGVYIDIFPLDGCPKSSIRSKLFRVKEKILKYSVSNVFFIENDTNKLNKMIKKTAAMLYPDYKKSVIKLDKLYRKHSYSECQKVANLCGAWGVKEVLPKDVFGEGTQGEFEGLKVNLPEKTHEYLTCVYGNYMELPPTEKRVGHHYCTVIDLEKPYTEYIK